MKRLSRGSILLLLVALATIALAPFPAAATVTPVVGAGDIRALADPTLPPTDGGDMPLLDGEQLSVTNSSAGEFPVDGTTQGEFSCGSTSDLTVDVTGHAYGPYPGEFTETLHAHIVDGMVTLFDVSFTIDSGATMVTGAAHYTGPGAEASCSAQFDEYDGWIYRFSIGSGGGGYEPLQLEQSATIVDGSGSTPDAGHILAGVNFYCVGSPVFASNCEVATTVLRFTEESPPPPPPPPGDAPTVLSVVFPSTLENGSEPVTITASVTMTSDIGVREGLCEVVPPEEGGGTSCSGSEIIFFPPRGSGNAVGWLTSAGGDTYEAQVTFPAYAAVGTWSALLVPVDLDYNSAYLANGDLDAAGFPSSIEVTGTDDVTPPVLTSLSDVSLAIIDMGSPDPLARQLVLTATASDDYSGVYGIGLWLGTATGDLYVTGFEPVGGDQYVATIPFEYDYLLGNWSVQQITLEDVVGNTTVVYPDYPREFQVIKSVSGSIAAGETFSNATDPWNLPPLTVELTSPLGGDVSVVSHVITDAPAGYTMLGYQLDITADPGTASQPLVLHFVINQYLIPPDVNPSSITVLRNGVAVPPCTVSTGAAVPDPCVSERSTTGDGDTAITVLTSHASEWLFGVADTLSARAGHQAALSTLQALTVDGKAAKAVNKAIEALRLGQADSLWADDSHLNPRTGAKAFDLDKAALNELLKKELTGYSQVGDVIAMLLDAGHALAQTAIDDAVAANGKARDIQAANAELAKGDALRASGKFEQAIDSYKAAWDKAQKSLR